MAAIVKAALVLPMAHPILALLAGASMLLQKLSGTEEEALQEMYTDLSFHYGTGTGKLIAFVIEVTVRVGRARPNTLRGIPFELAHESPYESAYEQLRREGPYDSEEFVQVDRHGWPRMRGFTVHDVRQVLKVHKIYYVYDRFSIS
eukprot:CAMPEP_0206600704 /NCGR_PEP_ID=MMETSP0325_2-20121206/46013_1 /ASSEMBLY_ACC=CAM_ASM_000347 /TAXON_ID=2866 /ORGANISM="Crypthecodinium cohnii, Strain Seligo" /LENGTH=145 /DNA_ID=CAMNT_0054112177 /DNA_START=173 /DNA_END=611 /DNA_ORIENTATION=+